MWDTTRQNPEGVIFGIKTSEKRHKDHIFRNLAKIYGGSRAVPKGTGGCGQAEYDDETRKISLRKRHFPSGKERHLPVYNKTSLQKNSAYRGGFCR